MRKAKLRRLREYSYYKQVKKLVHNLGGEVDRAMNLESEVVCFNTYRGKHTSTACVR